MFKRTLMASAGLLALSLSAGSAVAQHDHPQHGTADQLGTVKFANSCKPEVQDELGQAVALLHSFWWSLGETTFRNVLVHDPTRESGVLRNFGLGGKAKGFHFSDVLSFHDV